MQVADIGRLVRYKIQQRAPVDRNTNRFMVAEHDMEAIAAEIAAELSQRMTRPVITFTHNQVLNAAAECGFNIIVVDNGGGGQRATPVDSAGEDVYDKVHRLIDWAFRDIMARLPEVELQKELNQ